jgi:hypothetical protein
VNYYDELRQGRYGSMELNQCVGPNQLKGLAVGAFLYIALFLVGWLFVLFQPNDQKPATRSITMELHRTVLVEPPRAQEKSPAKEAGGGGGGGGGAAEVQAERGLRRAVPRLMRVADLTGGEVVGASVEVLGASIRAVLPGEAETPIGNIDLAARASGRRLGGGRSGIGDDNDGVGGQDDFGGGPGFGSGAGGGIGTGIGTGFGPGIGPGSGGGSGGGRGRGHGLGDGDGEGDSDGGIAALAPSPKMTSAPIQTPPKFDVITVRPTRSATIPKVDRSPIVDWIELHKKPVPTTLQKPEILNQRAGDATTWVEFDDDQGRHYVLYLLGRNSRPPQLNIFLVTEGRGTLLQDEGARGETEVFKIGTATGAGENPTVQLDQLPPGRPEAKQMMAVFTAWWNHVQGNRL